MKLGVFFFYLACVFLKVESLCDHYVTGDQTNLVLLILYRQ
jgi:hypothetical protein